MFELETATPGARDTAMFAEAGEAAARIGVQYAANARPLAALGVRLRRKRPSLVLTCARGSSDHAALYAKYLIETRIGIAVCSAGPSVASLYRATIDARKALCLAVSQSGRSPDLVASVRMLKESGAFVAALVNEAGSPLAEIADETFPLHAGPERAVAATKSFLGSLACIARLVAEWAQDMEMLDALDRLPAQLEAAWGLDWPANGLLEKAHSLFVLGRGLGFGAAHEAALKLKETCVLHAEAYSAAEVLHGPAALVRPGFPVLAFSQGDATQAGMRQVLRKLSGYGACILVAGIGIDTGQTLPVIRAHPAIEPMLMIQSFYRFANTLSLRRGYNPDRPPHLSKVTETH